jgi:hypothetical protein
MHPRLRGFLDQEILVHERWSSVPRKCSHIERIAELRFVSESHGGGYGITVLGGGLYGREGCTKEENEELMFYGSFLQGVELMEHGSLKEVSQETKAIWEKLRVVKENENYIG